MRRNNSPRTFAALALCSIGALLAIFSFAATTPAKSDASISSPSTGSPSKSVPPTGGTGWSVFASPNPSGGGLLTGVTCASGSQCWAVGYNNPTPGGGVHQTVIEQWNGTSWTIVSSPNTIPVAGHPLASNRFYGVTCASASDCWAVGYSDNGNAFFGEPLQTLIEHWNGNSWAIVTSPNNGTATNLLNGVTCVSASQCLAVGFYFNGNGSIFQTLIEQWNGTAWAIVTSPNSSATADNTLGGVTCPSTSQCWAVGESGDPIAGNTQTLIEQWNGTSWAIVTSPNPSVHANELFGVTCPSASECWAVGIHAESGAVPQTLIEHYTAL